MFLNLILGVSLTWQLWPKRGNSDQCDKRTRSHKYEWTSYNHMHVCLIIFGYSGSISQKDAIGTLGGTTFFIYLLKSSWFSGGSLAYCSSWGHKESDTTWWLKKNKKLIYNVFAVHQSESFIHIFILFCILSHCGLSWDIEYRSLHCSVGGLVYPFYI